MIKNLLPLIILLLSFSSLANNVPTKTEFELKVPLTITGFQKLKTLFVDQYQAQESFRTDLYFDIFEGEHFVLKNLSNPVKLRFQDNKWQIQKSHSLNPVGYIVRKMSQSFAITVDSIDFNKIQQNIMDFHLELSELNPKALDTGKKIHAQLIELKLFNQAIQLCELCTSDKAYYSSHMNQKKRYKIKIKEKGLEFAIFVGATKSSSQETYELEAELKNSNDIESGSKILTNWLDNHGLNTNDILHAPTPDQTLLTERNLHSLLKL